MSQCQGYRGPSVLRCRRLAVRELIVGCVHEHVRTIASCEDCAGHILSGNFNCYPCLTAPAGHDHSCALRAPQVIR